MNFRVLSLTYISYLYDDLACFDSSRVSSLLDLFPLGFANLSKVVANLCT